MNIPKYLKETAESRLAQVNIKIRSTNDKITLLETDLCTEKAELKKLEEEKAELCRFLTECGCPFDKDTTIVFPALFKSDRES